MASIKISELNELTSTDGADLLPIVDSSANETKKITYGNLLKNNYGTNEINTNKNWINNKPIYRKVIEINELPEVAYQSYAETTYYTGIFNADYVISIDGCFWGTNVNGKMFVPINYPLMGLKSGIFSVGTLMAPQSLSGHEGELIVHLYSTDTSNFYEKGYVILEYTKTTD